MVDLDADEAMLWWTADNILALPAEYKNKFENSTWRENRLASVVQRNGEIVFDSPEEWNTGRETVYFCLTQRDWCQS